MPGSASGSLFHSGYPSSARHQRLRLEDRDRQLLYYVDDSTQRKGETLRDYSTRMVRAVENMGFEVRMRPSPGVPGRSEQYGQKRWIISRGGNEYRLKFTPGSNYDAEYVRAWRVEKAARQARNAQRRAEALQRLRNEHENIGLPGLPSPPPVEDSVDELYTFNSTGPLQRPAGNEVGQNSASILPPAPQSKTCEPCHRVRRSCTLQKTGAPCDWCVSAGRQEE